MSEKWETSQLQWNDKFLIQKPPTSVLMTRSDGAQVWSPATSWKSPERFTGNYGRELLQRIGKLTKDGKLPLDVMLEYVPKEIEANSQSEMMRLINLLGGNIIRDNYLEAIQPGGAVAERANWPFFLQQLGIVPGRILTFDGANKGGFEIGKKLQTLATIVTGEHNERNEQDGFSRNDNQIERSVGGLHLEALRRATVARHIAEHAEPDRVGLLLYDFPKSLAIAKSLEVQDSPGFARRRALQDGLIHGLARVGVFNDQVREFGSLQEVLEPVLSTM